MRELIENYLALAGVVILGTLFMLLLFAASAIVVTKLGRTNIISKGIIIVFSILNALYNITLGSLLCLDLPERLGEPSTKRMQRYKRIYNSDSTGIHKWRWNIAQGVCKWLNLFDPDHC